MATAINDRGKLHAGLRRRTYKAPTPLARRSCARKSTTNHVVLLDVHWDFPNRLHAIYRKDDAVFLGDLPDFRHGIDHANLIVAYIMVIRMVLAYRFAYVFWITRPSRRTGRLGHFIAVLFQPRAGIQQRLMLNGCVMMWLPFSRYISATP